MPLLIFFSPVFPSRGLSGPQLYVVQIISLLQRVFQPFKLSKLQVGFTQFTFLFHRLCVKVTRPVTLFTEQCPPQLFLRLESPQKKFPEARENDATGKDFVFTFELAGPSPQS